MRSFQELNGRGAALRSACEALESTGEHPVIAAFQRLFAERGLPLAMRSDNGLPFASPNGLYNLSKLSVWWLRLGVTSVPPLTPELRWSPGRAAATRRRHRGCPPRESRGAGAPRNR